MALGRMQRRAQRQSDALLGETQGSATRKHSLDVTAWLQDLDPFTDGKISAVLSKVLPVQKTAGISL